jgi:quercetin dioxygenase-like cupin family protein
MIGRRYSAVVLVALVAFAVGYVSADSAKILGSRVFDSDAVPVKQTDVGSVRSFVNAPTVTLQQLEIHVTTLDPGKMSHPPHKHPNEELIVIRQGTVETLSNGRWERAGPGSVIFNASNQLHALKNVGTEPAVYTVVNWKTGDTPKASE